MKDHTLYNDLAKYYDIMYSKSGRIDYASLVKFLDNLFKKFKCKEILDIGCGTATTTLMLHKLGYEIEGTDLNRGMLDIAAQKASDIKFFQSDMRDIRTKRKFDAAFISFRSFSYITENEDVEKSIRSVNNALKKGGIFVFDNFSAKNVILSKIKSGKLTRKDTLEARQGDIHITRNSNSITTFDGNVKMHWTADYKIKDGKKLIRKRETSILRAFFLDELETLLKYNGFRIIDTYGDYKFAKFNNQINLIIVAEKVN